MQIDFYKMSDDNRKVDKSLTVDNLILTLQGNLKSDCDLMNPVFELSYDSRIFSCNYLSVYDFSRKYYITNMEVSMQRVYIYCHVDVLTSFSTQIKELYGIIERQEKKNRCNFYLPDKAFKAEARKIISTRCFPGTFDKEHSSIVLTTGGRS